MKLTLFVVLEQSTVAWKFAGASGGEGQSLVCLFNFTPVPREDYRLGLPVEGAYREVLNTDADAYGGSNVGNAGRIMAVAEPWQDRPASAVVRLPPLGAVFLQHEDPA